MFESAAIIKDHLVNRVFIVLGETCEFHPGRHGSGTEREDTCFANYKVLQNNNFRQPYIHSDVFDFEIYHSSYLSLQRIVEDIQREFGQDNPHNLSFYDDAYSDGIKFISVELRLMGTDHNEFIEAQEYFSATAAIVYEYVVLNPSVPSRDTQAGYIKA